MSRTHGTAALSMALLIGWAIVGCGERDEPAGEVHTYQVRGQITAMPGDEPGQELTIHHEAIDDFRDSHGDIDPMPAMTMPFPPAPDVSLEGFEVGDTVLATLEVQWQPEAGWVMTEIEKLPEDTELDLSTAAADEDDHHHHDHQDHDQHHDQDQDHDHDDDH